MLCDRLKDMSDTQWMKTLMTACDQCGLKKISLHLKEGHVKSNPLNKYLIMYFIMVTMSSADVIVPIVAVTVTVTVLWLRG